MCTSIISLSSHQGRFSQGVLQAEIAQSRIAIDQARLLTLKAAHLIDKYGTKEARREVEFASRAIPSPNAGFFPSRLP